jgi:hypothetical protein
MGEEMNMNKFACLPIKPIVMIDAQGIGPAGHCRRFEALFQEQRLQAGQLAAIHQKVKIAALFGSLGQTKVAFPMGVFNASLVEGCNQALGYSRRQSIPLQFVSDSHCFG